jgi:hypothetical protein
LVTLGRGTADDEDHGKISLARSDGVNHCIINVFKGISDSRGESFKVRPPPSPSGGITPVRNASSSKIELPRSPSFATSGRSSGSGFFPPSVRIVHMSDTHNFLSMSNNFDFLPQGSILIHSGNFTLYGSKKEFDQFNTWLESIATRFPYRIVCLGCRDVKEFGNNWDVMKRYLTNATHVLCHESATVLGIKFYGAPWHWGHHKNYKVRSGAPSSTSGRFEDVPEGVHVLVTHGAALNCLDTPTLPGSRELAEALRRVKPSVHLHGHSRGAHGVVQAFAKNPLVINSALCDPDCLVMYACPHVIRATQTSSDPSVTKGYASWNFAIDSLMA